jgi:signal transduction histidine kinase
MPVTAPAFVSALSAVLALAVAASVVGLRQLPRWRQHRWLILSPVCAAAFAACDIGLTSTWPDAGLVVLHRVQMTVAALWGLVWLRYTDEDLGPIRRRLFLAFATPVAASALVLWLPHVGYTGAIRLEPAHWPGVHYRLAVLTPAGTLAGGAFGFALAVCTVRYARAVLRGVPRSLPLLLAAAVMLVAALCDVWLDGNGVLGAPIWIDVAFLFSVACIGQVLMGRWKDDMLALSELSSTLETRVEQRTRELEQAMRALSRTQHLAAVGRLAARMAHEINNPAAVVGGNLDYVLEYRNSHGKLPPDAEEALVESRDAIARITMIVRRLLAGTNSARQDDSIGFDVAAALTAGAQRVRPMLRDGIELTVMAPPGMFARGGPTLVAHVVADLVQNAADSIPAGRGGSISIRAKRDADRIVISVEDDGTGMDEETLARLFEPFFSTKPIGTAVGLSLAVALAVLRTIGGDLRIDSELGRGTIATILLEPMPVAQTAA